jgi:hypothetical protein
MTDHVAPAKSLFPLLLGIPDNGQAAVRMGQNGAINYVFLGNGRIVTDLAPQTKQRMLPVIFGPGVPLRMPPALRTRPHINAIADADMSQLALQMLEQHLCANDVACFNHPSAVLGTARERVAETLAGIDGLHVPRTIRVRLEEPADLARAVRKNSFVWPLIVRTTGSHRGAATVRIDGPQQAKEGLRGLAWGGHDLYLTEYVDSRDRDGHYRKLRLVIVGGEVFMRHQVVAAEWMVHAGDRDIAALQEEARLLATFASTLLPELAERLRALTNTIDLDYFGIDCNLRPDGRLLIYEVNALMDILINTMPGPNCWDAPIREVREALGALVVDPSRWRHPRREVATA